VSALGVTGDPAGWQYASDTIGAAVRQLTNELDAADVHGGSGLRGAWYGPVADAHQELWNKRHARYGDLLYQAGRAAGALGDFAGRLWNFQVQAANLESQWLGLGLHLTSDGLSFTLPLGWENLEHEIQSLLHARVAEAVREVEAMWDDIRGAVSDLMTIAESVVDAAEDFGAIELSVSLAAVGWTAGTLWRDVIEDPLGDVSSVLGVAGDLIKAGAAHNLAVAQSLSAEWVEDSDQDVQAAGRSILLDAQDSQVVDDGFGDLAKTGGTIFAVAAAGITVGQTYLDARKQGWVTAIENHAGGLAEAAAGFAVGAVSDALVAGALAGAVVAAPVLVPVGLAVAGAIVVAGVGAGVNYEVGHHRAGTTRVLTDIGHGIADTATWSAEETGLSPASAS
jgi:hypothetical protein